jgi:hypothetical protein
MKKVTVNNRRNDSRFVVDKVEAKYNATFVGQLPILLPKGVWSCGFADIFYQAIPTVDGYSNYFVLYMDVDDLIKIMSGESAVQGIIRAVRANDGEIIYSRGRHDFVYSSDNSCFIGGDRDYIKSDRQIIGLKIIDGEFYELEGEDYVFMKLKGEIE